LRFGSRTYSENLLPKPSGKYLCCHSCSEGKQIRVRLGNLPRSRLIFILGCWWVFGKGNGRALPRLYVVSNIQFWQAQQQRGVMDLSRQRLGVEILKTSLAYRFAYQDWCARDMPVLVDREICRLGFRAWRVACMTDFERPTNTMAFEFSEYAGTVP